MVFIGIYQDVYQQWTAIFINNDNHRQDLVSDIDEDDMDDIILNSGGLLCYISGWLINKPEKVKQKENKNAIANVFLQK